jgi:hypothetical protein
MVIGRKTATVRMVFTMRVEHRHPNVIRQRGIRLNDKQGDGQQADDASPVLEMLEEHGRMVITEKMLSNMKAVLRGTAFTGT